MIASTGTEFHLLTGFVGVAAIQVYHSVCGWETCTTVAVPYLLHAIILANFSMMQEGLSCPPEYYLIGITWTDCQEA